MIARPMAILVLLCLLPLKAVDQAPVAVAAKNVKVMLTDASDPDYVTLSVSFVAVARGQDGVDLRVASGPVFYTRVDRLLENKGWTTILDSPIRIDVSPPKYKNCTMVRRGETFDFSRVQADAVLKKADPETRSNVILRFGLVGTCLADGRIISVRLITEPIRISVPSW